MSGRLLAEVHPDAAAGAGRPLSTAWLLAIRCLSVLAVATLVVLSWIPSDLEVRTRLPGQVEHMLAYAGAAALAALSTRSGARRRLGFGLVALAGLLEVGQLWIPGRNAQVIDFAASSAGVPIGICIADLLVKPLLRRVFRRGPGAPRGGEEPSG